MQRAGTAFSRAERRPPSPPARGPGPRARMYAYASPARHARPASPTTPAAGDTDLLAACVAALARAAAAPQGPAAPAAASAAAPAPASAAAFAAAPLADPAAYLERLARRQRFSPPCAVLAMHYLERVSASLPLGAHTARRLLLVAHMLAAKFHDDHTYSNRDWAAFEGLSTAEINALELVFLKALDWRAAVSSATYLEKRARVLAEFAELTHLAEVTQLAELAKLAELAACIDPRGAVPERGSLSRRRSILLRVDLPV